MIWLRSALFNLAFWTWGTVTHVLALPLLLLPRRLTGLAGRFWVRGTLWLLRVLCGLGYEIRGRENLPDGPFILACKHQSAWETLTLALFLPEAAYVLKKELLWLPLFGLYLMKSGVVAVDRSGGSKALKDMVARARAFADQERPLVIFPEGTRTAPGQHRPYHPGVAALYRQLELPVVPAALNSGLFWGRKTFLKKPGTIVLEFLPPIPPGLPRKAFMGRLEREIETAAARLSGTERPPLMEPQPGSNPRSPGAAELP